MGNPMDSIADLLTRYVTSYSLEVEALLTWFPVKSTADLSQVKMRGGTLTYSNRDQAFQVDVFGTHTEISYSLGQGGDEDTLAPDNSVIGFITIGLNQDSIFQADLQLTIGSANRRKSYVLQPDTRVPFMINLRAAGRDQVVRDTAAVLQGVFTTSPIMIPRDFVGISGGRVSGP